MDTIGAYIDALAAEPLERAEWVQKNSCSYLVTVESSPDGSPPEQASQQTVAADPLRLRKASIAAREARVYPIQKRPGANAHKDVLVGRSRECDVWINEAEVSKHHARIVLGGPTLLLVDEGSTNGTFVNDEPLAKGKPTPVKNYDAIRFGRGGPVQFLDAESFYDYLNVLRRFVGF